jgi:hypothetical protein
MTEDQKTTDLRPWGYAPGGYLIECQDCGSQPIRERTIADKRAWRCEAHALKARDAAEWQAAQPPMICDYPEAEHV